MLNATIINILIKVGLKLLSWGRYKILPQADYIPDDVNESVMVLCEKNEQLPDVSGEWKRHQVYSALIKRFPGVSKRILALAIELYLNKR